MYTCSTRTTYRLTAQHSDNSFKETMNVKCEHIVFINSKNVWKVDLAFFETDRSKKAGVLIQLQMRSLVII